jgi:hypothetical protein
VRPLLSLARGFRQTRRPTACVRDRRHILASSTAMTWMSLHCFVLRPHPANNSRATRTVPGVCGRPIKPELP